jgi:hypothetical protein
VPLENIFGYTTLLIDHDGATNNSFNLNDQDNRSKLKKLFDSCTSNTTKEDLLEQLRNQLLAHITKDEG